MSINIDRRLNECVRTLNDGKLLATLSGGDEVAQELKYHTNCFSFLYYREKAHLSRLDDHETCVSLENEVYPLVFL
ncbi:hypothetical protein DPMN_149585 [Dreissena polymorpha]|uniref:Uncharacterized protein n=1 Tax=Dreissena polymorpha TaxID=45954 RepID=A0A9D4FDT3_DREPO|nr:hypothetical protein DPMN_149585 [Dreissena polymorpha]